MPEDSFTLPRGMKDITPQEMQKRLWVTRKIESVITRYGFQLVEPSTLEHLETLEAKSGPMIRNEIYHFKDKAGRDLGLRFDLTVGMTRMVTGRSDLPEPLKLACIAGMWRYDEPQFARYRYFHQWDLEIYGSKDPLADAEVIAVSIDILDALGLKDYEILISNRQLVEGYLEAVGITDPAQREHVIRLVDKVRKLPKEDLIKQFSDLNIRDTQLERIFAFITLQQKPPRAISDLKSLGCTTPRFQGGLENLESIVDSLTLLKRVEKCKLDMSVVRGLDYYDGMVFEAYDKGGEQIGAILGGGRYDRLGALYGKHEFPCTGVAGGIERLFLSLERQNLFSSSHPPAQLFIAAANDKVRRNVIELVQEIRSIGASCEMDLKNRSLKNQLEYANAIKIPYAVILGPHEIKEKTVNLKDMKSRREKRMTRSEFRRWLENIHPL
ncbi:histidine--tRNA ligase [[Eubacterium] cellulosolvens]